MSDFIGSGAQNEMFYQQQLGSMVSLFSTPEEHYTLQLRSPSMPSYNGGYLTNLVEFQGQHFSTSNINKDFCKEQPKLYHPFGDIGDEAKQANNEQCSRECRENNMHKCMVNSTTANYELEKRRCRCPIDVSTPATLERDFYAWLNGVEPNESHNSCFSANGYNHHMNVIFEPALYAMPMPMAIATTSPSSSGSSSSGSSGSSTSSISINQMNSLSIEGKPRVRRKRNVDKTSGRGTNLYGRPYCPGRPLSMDERGQIINLFHAGMKVNAISKQLCISHGCVSKIITRFRETGLLHPSSHSEYRRRKKQKQMEVGKK